MDTNEPGVADVTKRETLRLIASDKVEGTPVKRSNGDQIGTIKRLMIDKSTGRVAYAVMSFGGFLGLGQEYHPVPWEKLQFNTTLDGYQLDVTEDQLRGAPSWKSDTEWSDDHWARSVYDYYKVPPYWL